MRKLDRLADIGQSVWYDYIRRAFLDSGGLERLVEEGVRGVTSNPAIFDKAIAGSEDYDEDIARFATEGRPVGEIYEALVVADIRAAADQMRSVYDRSSGADGFVSLEVSPELADNTAGTVADAQRLFRAVDRPNLMIKVPATEAGVPAVRELIGQGMSVNVTLLFGVDNYEMSPRHSYPGSRFWPKAGLRSKEDNRWKALRPWLFGRSFPPRAGRSSRNSVRGRKDCCGQARAPRTRCFRIHCTWTH